MQQNVVSPYAILEGLEGPYAHWARVPVGAPGATLLLTAGPGGGRAEVYAGRVTFALAPDARACFAVVTTQTHAVVYARVRERGVSVLASERVAGDGAGAAPGAAHALLYTRHWSVDKTVVVAQLRVAVPDVPVDPGASYAFSLPAPSGARVARYGALATALALAEVESWSTGVAPADAEPPGELVGLPPDAYQVTHFIARDLQSAKG